jgi:flagellar motor switch protein FliM
MNQVLSQNEVDALLAAVSDGDIGAGEELLEEEDDSGVIVYDLTSQDRIIRGRMPTLEIIFEKFVRLFRISLSTALRKIASINVSSTDLLKFGEFMNTLPMPSCMNILKFGNLRGYAVLVIESKLAYALVDGFFGGTDRPFTKIEGKDFTAIELSIIRKVVMLIIEDLERAWSTVHQLNLSYARAEVNPQFIGVVPQSDVIVATTFEIELENASGIVTLVIPYASLEPIKAKLSATFQGEQLEAESNWTGRIKKQLLDTEAIIKVELGKATLSVEEILNMQKNDVIVLDHDANVPLPIMIEGIEKFTGLYGNYKGRKAIQIVSDIMKVHEEK